MFRAAAVGPQRRLRARALQLGAKARRVQHIAVALAKGVVHFHHHGAQALIRTVAVPKTHGLEGKAQHARVAVQPDFAIGVGNALGCQQRVKPGQRATSLRASSVAMVAVVKAHQAKAVARQG